MVYDCIDIVVRVKNNYKYCGLHKEKRFIMGATTVLKYGSRLLILFMCIPIHEFAHAWAATKLGDDTPRYQGRLTLNPLAHLDPIGSLGILLCGFGWGKPVQVNPIRFKKYRKGMMLTAAAGPISNLILAYIFMILYKVARAGLYSSGSEALMWLTFIINYVVIINIGLAVFNLIPIYPLDGQKIISYFAPAKFNAFMDQYQFYISIGFLLLIFSNMLDRPLGALQNLALTIMDKLTFYVDPIVNAIMK